MQTLSKISSALDRGISWPILMRPVLTRATRWLALVVLVGSFLLPTGRFGPDLCPLHRATGLPCPGCGVTRGLVFLSHGSFSEALGANPWVVVLWPLLFLLAASLAIPSRAWAAFEAHILRWEPWPSRVVRVLLLAFLGFGLVRFVYFMATAEEFP